MKNLGRLIAKCLTVKATQMKYTLVLVFPLAFLLLGAAGPAAAQMTNWTVRAGDGPAGTWREKW